MTSMNHKYLFFVLFTALSALIKAQEIQFFKPGEIWPDENGVHINAHGGGIFYHDGKYYWFGEHKISGEAGNSAQVGVSCYSSKDLLTWRDEGIALRVVENNPQSDISKGCILERPKVIYNTMTGKFVMWFHLELKGKGYNAARSAVADSIFGKWTELGNPCRGTDSALTFHSQSTSVLPIQGKKDALIFIADRWTPGNPIDGRYVWLPLIFEKGKPVLRWIDKWDLSVFDQKSN